MSKSRIRQAEEAKAKRDTTKKGKKTAKAVKAHEAGN
jgi:hypothetical protein